MTEIITLDDGTEIVVHARIHDGRDDHFMEVARVDMPIADLLDEAREFARHWGIPQRDVSKAMVDNDCGCFDPLGVVRKYSPDQPRDDQGQWTSIGGSIASATVSSLEHDPAKPFPEGGSTTSPHGRSITKGRSVSPYPEHSRVYKSKDARQRAYIAKAVERFRNDKRSLLSQPGHAIGTWVDPNTGHLWLDVVVVVRTHREAARLARAHNQIAYYDLTNNRTVETGGTGLIKRLRPGRLRGGLDPRGGSGAAGQDDGLGQRGDARGDRGSAVVDPLGLSKAAPAPVARPLPNLSPRGEAILDIVVKFNPSQRRAPKGTPTGGQWVDDDTGLGDDLLSPGAEHGPSFTPTGRPSAPNNPDATRVSSMPPEFLATQLAKLEAVGLTPADLERNIEALFLRARDEFPEVYAMGLHWYEEANTRIGEIAAEFGMDKTVLIGMVAAMSPSSEWSQNVAMARELALMHTQDRRVTLTRNEMKCLMGRSDKAAAALVKAVGKDGIGPRFSNLPPEQAAWAFMTTGQRKGLLAEGLTPIGNPIKVQFATGADNIAKAIKMARGGNISVAMGGQHKVRSFFNNLKDPTNAQGRDDITIDTHAASVAQAFRMPMTSKRADNTFWNGSSKSSNQNGLYPIYADAYRAVAKKYNLHPHQLQAIAWVTWQHVRDEYPGVVVPKKEKGKPQGDDIFAPAIPRGSDYTTARASTRARYGIQIGKRDGVLPRYSSQVSDWQRYRDGMIDYQTYLQRIGSDDAY